MCKAIKELLKQSTRVLWFQRGENFEQMNQSSIAFFFLEEVVRALLILDTGKRLNIWPQPKERLVFEHRETGGAFGSLEKLEWQYWRPKGTQKHCCLLLETFAELWSCMRGCRKVKAHTSERQSVLQAHVAVEGRSVHILLFMWKHCRVVL